MNYSHNRAFERGLVLNRIVDGHLADNGEFHHLVQTYGLNRHWGDDYYRSTEGRYIGISAEWDIFKPWLSIVYSQRHDVAKAVYWLVQTCKEITNGMIPEAHQNGRPNEQTPLAWAQAIALIAFEKLPIDQQKELSA